MIVACPDGGTSIEDLAESNPELILKVRRGFCTVCACEGRGGEGEQGGAPFWAWKALRIWYFMVVVGGVIYPFSTSKNSNYTVYELGHPRSG